MLVLAHGVSAAPQGIPEGSVKGSVRVPPPAKVARLATVSDTVNGQTIFSSLGSNNSFGTIGWCVDGSSEVNCGITGFLTMGARFQALATLPLTSINLALGYSGGTNSVTITLSADGTTQPGAMLESWTVTNLPTYSGTLPLTTVADTLNLTLNAGQYYWLTVQAAASDTEASWYTNSSGLSGLEFDDSYGWGYISSDVMVAFSVIGTPVSVTLLTALPAYSYTTIQGQALTLYGCAT